MMGAPPDVQPIDPRAIEDLCTAADSEIFEITGVPVQLSPKDRRAPYREGGQWPWRGEHVPLRLARRRIRAKKLVISTVDACRLALRDGRPEEAQWLSIRLQARLVLWRHFLNKRPGGR